MAQIDYVQLQDGTVATANEFNERFGKIHNEINGNLDTSNIKNGAITREKIANGSITSEKLSVSKYVDDNGWMVTDYGSHKEYSYKKIGTIVLEPNNWKVVTLPLPKDIASIDEIIVTATARIGLAETILNLVPDINKKNEIRFSMFNAHHSYLYTGDYRIDVSCKRG